MLEALGLVAQATDRVKSRDQSFGHLMIVLRDSNEDEMRRAGNKLLENEEPAGETSAETRAIVSRNAVRNHLRTAFQSISVQLLPRRNLDIREYEGFVRRD